jgi:hypothetical protein
MPYRISVLSNRISGNIARLYGDRYGLAITEWRVMAILPAPRACRPARCPNTRRWTRWR